MFNYNFNLNKGVSKNVINLDVIEIFSDNLANLFNTYNNSNIMIPIGEDFAFKNPDESFNYFEDYIREYYTRFNQNLTFSTPSQYLDIFLSNKYNIKDKENDIFPLRQYELDWVGFYTTRPTLKYLIRQMSKDYQSLMKLLSLYSISKRLKEE